MSQRAAYDAIYGDGAGKRDRAICLSAGFKAEDLDSLFGHDESVMPATAAQNVVTTAGGIDVSTQLQREPQPTVHTHGYTLRVHHDNRRWVLRPWWATITVGIANPENGIRTARTRKTLLRKARRYCQRDMLARGMHGQPQIKVVEA